MVGQIIEWVGGQFGRLTVALQQSHNRFWVNDSARTSLPLWGLG